MLCCVVLCLVAMEVVSTRLSAWQYHRSKAAEIQREPQVHSAAQSKRKGTTPVAFSTPQLQQRFSRCYSSLLRLSHTKLLLHALRFTLFVFVMQLLVRVPKRRPDLIEVVRISHKGTHVKSTRYVFLFLFWVERFG